jgi:hypothetical protein
MGIERKAAPFGPLLKEEAYEEVARADARVLQAQAFAA